MLELNKKWKMIFRMKMTGYFYVFSKCYHQAMDHSATSLMSSPIPQHLIRALLPISLLFWASRKLAVGLRGGLINGNPKNNAS